MRGAVGFRDSQRVQGMLAGETNVVQMLEALLPGRVSQSAAVRAQHANSLTWIAAAPPDVVVWPENEAEVQAVVRLAGEHRTPVIPFGAGTSLEGHVNAPLGGISLDLSRMDRVLAVNTDDLDAEVEAGVTREGLAAHLRDTGLFFAVDPGAGQATIGGMAATRASGTNTIRYGTMRDNVLSVNAVMADGRLVSTGGRARKSSAGYDLTRLLIGSEGTLGVITRLRIRLHPVPPSIVAAVIPFATLAGACRTTIEAIQSGLALARIELLDALQIAAVNKHAGLGLAEAPTLFIELHGTEGATWDAREALSEIASGHGGLGFAWAAREEERRRLWRARHDAFWSVREAWPGKHFVVTDACVPISRLADCILETEADFARAGIVAPIVGHVGDGNFHAIAIMDSDNSVQSRAVEELIGRLVTRALAMGGTSTGEHGIGEGKLAALAHEMGPGIEVMRAIKRALDPLGILNPGKIGG